MPVAHIDVSMPCVGSSDCATTCPCILRTTADFGCTVIELPSIYSGPEAGTGKQRTKELYCCGPVLLILSSTTTVAVSESKVPQFGLCITGQITIVLLPMRKRPLMCESLKSIGMRI